MDGSSVSKADARVSSYGEVDELNAMIGVARLSCGPDLQPMLERIQNDLFDLGADLATPATDKMAGALRVVGSQVERLEREIDRMNAELSPLTSFVLPAGSPASASLHLARTVCRRAERAVVALSGRRERRARGSPALSQPAVRPPVRRGPLGERQGRGRRAVAAGRGALVQVQLDRGPKRA